MARPVGVGIDIGTYQTKVVVAEQAPNEKGVIFPQIIGTGSAETKGLRHGYIINPQEVTKSLSEAVKQAENSAGIKIKRAIFSIGGIGLSSTTSTGTILVSRADKEITENDINQVLEESRHSISEDQILNKKILHSIPLTYKIDGKPVFGDPVGMKGNRLELKTFFVTCLERHYNDIINVAEEIGIIVEDIIASPIAASIVTLSKAQKIAGSILTNIGSETVSIVIYEDNKPISLEVFPLGGSDITKDIALGLRVPLDEAEEIKKGSIVGLTYPRKKLDDIITARLSDIFDLIEAHLKKIGRNGLLPAGVIITGGSSRIEMIETLAKNNLRLPAKIGSVNFPGTRNQSKDSSWSVAYGLCLINLDNDDGNIKEMGIVSNAKSGLISWFKQFLP